MNNYTDESLLEIVEMYAEEMGYVSSEAELSERFDDMIGECCPNIDTDDNPMISEAFNNWADSLCKDGEIHPIQYNDYCNVGKYA